ncbi:MAG: hypothetical protein OXG39_02220 [Chloroflexi bacterium]|nr:hypothetical protein [Chloroflexota bacterium]
MIGGQAEHGLADLEAVMGGVDGFDAADHLVPGFADGGGVAVVRQVMDMADIAAAEGQAQGLDDGVIGDKLGLGRIDEGGLAAGDYLDGFHGLGSPGVSGTMALIIALSRESVRS